MNVLVTGVKGQLGYDVMNELARRGYEGVGVDVAEMDITDSEAVEKVMTEVQPDKVVHCAAWTAVDAAEDNQEVCHKVNVDGTANIAKMCGKLDIFRTLLFPAYPPEVLPDHRYRSVYRSDHLQPSECHVFCRDSA